MERGDKWLLLGVGGMVTVLACSIWTNFGLARSTAITGATIGIVAWAWAAISYWRERAEAAEEVAKAASRAYDAAISAKGGWQLNMDADLEAMDLLVAAVEKYRRDS